MTPRERHGKRQPPSDCHQEVGELTERARAWARARADIRALALVGSRARNAAGPDSDVDLILLTDAPETFTADDGWLAAFPGAQLVKTEAWGAVTERRVRLVSGLNIDFGVGRTSWAATDPVDAGTHRVVTDGMRILHDPDGLLARLAAACRSDAPHEPVRIAAYDRQWPEQFERERVALEQVLGGAMTGGIHHVGSTAVPGLDAKPVIDILVGVKDLETARSYIEPLAALDYMYAPYRSDEMVWFCKPHPLHRTHHLHLVPTGSPRFRSKLEFRDYLRTHPAVAAEYAALKRKLADEFHHDREAYTEAKADFVDCVVRRARSDAAG